MARVTLTNISKVYPNGFKAVDDFNLDIAPGEFVVFVGPSGCGKSTTLRLIAGLEEDFSGTISIGDRIVNTVPPAQRDIAMVFQNYALYPHMTVFANMAMALKLKGVSKEEINRKVLETAKFLEVDHLLERKPGQLSGGQRQRVALGRAIVRQPKAFLFDEPLSNLDARLRVTTRAELKAMHQRLKTTSIYVTHDQEEAMTLGDRIVVMAKGRIQQAAPPLEVYRRPANRFVAAFVGTPPMNFLTGTLTTAGASPHFTEDGASGQRLTLTARTTLPAQGAPLVLGIRPTHFSLTASPGTSSLVATVRAVEPLGEQCDVQAITTAGTVLTARIPLTDAPPAHGSTITLFASTTNLIPFEPGEFGKNLAL